MSTGKPNGLVIGVDLDGVCAGYTEGLRRHVIKNFDVDPLTLIDPPSYSLFESWPHVFTSEDHFREVHGNAVEDGLYTGLQVMEGASETLWALSNEGFHLRVITSRFVNNGQNALVVAQTAQWLEIANIPYRDLMFVRHKADVFADIYIDDAPVNHEVLTAAGRNVLVFGAPYNQDLVAPRAENWTEVGEYIREFAAKR